MTTTTRSLPLHTWQIKLGVILFIVILSAIAVSPFFFMGKSEGGRRWYESSQLASEGNAGNTQNKLHFPETHDMRVHFDQMRSFYTGLSAGVLYPRWQEDTNRGFGAPTMNYYSPGIYYVTSACYWLTQNWNIALFIAHLLITIASGLVFFLYASRVMARLAGLLATAFYIFAPYHLTDQYQRGAIAELLTFVWMPLVLYFIDRLIFAKPQDGLYLEKGNELSVPRKQNESLPSSELWSIAGLAASYGATLWSHVPTAYQFTLMLAIILPLLAIMRKNLRSFVLSGLSLLLGAALTAVYLYPAAIEQNLIRSNLLTGEIPYQLTYLLTRINLPAGAFHEYMELLNYTWVLNVLLISGIPLLFFVFRKRILTFENLKSRVIALTVVGLLSSFMMLPASDFFRGMIPKLEIGVFSWRFLSISSFIAAMLFGIGLQMVCNVWEANRERQRLLLAVASVLMLCLVGFSFARVILPMRSFQYFEPRKEHLNNIMMPADVTLLPKELPLMQWGGFTKQQGEIRVEQWLPQLRTMTVKLPQDDEFIVRTFNFPGWIAIVDGKTVAISSYPELGAIDIALSAGTHAVRLEFLDTPARQLGNLLSLLAFALLLAIMAIAGVRAQHLHKTSSVQDVESTEINVEAVN